MIVCCAFLIIGTLAICAVIAFGQAEGTQLNVLSDSALYEGGEVVVQLTTVNGTPIANQSIGVDIIDFDGNVKTLNQTTDEEGKDTFDLGDLSAGEYTLECVFRGNSHYKQSNCTFDLEIKEEVHETVPAGSSDRFAQPCPHGESSVYECPTCYDIILASEWAYFDPATAPPNAVEGVKTHNQIRAEAIEKRKELGLYQ